MTIELANSNPIEYAGNGTSVTGSYPWKISAATELIVGFIVGGVYTQQVSGYTVAGVGSSNGGSITFASAPPLNTTVDLRPLTPDTQPTDFANLGAYLPESTTNSVDRCVRQIQDLTRRTYTFGIHGPDTESVAWPSLPGPPSRANQGIGFDAGGKLSLISSPGAFNQSTFNGYLLNAPTGGAQTLAEAAAGVSPTAFSTSQGQPLFEGDIRRYGALTTATDNSAAITAALSVSASGGNAAFIPGGTWNITNPIVSGASSSMYGEGATSIIVPTGCDGIQFNAQPIFGGSRFFADFVIQGPSTTNSSNNGITITIVSGRLTGIVFQNLGIQNMASAVYLATTVEGQGGLWNSEFRNCFFYNNYQGYYFNGQVIQLQIEGGMVEPGPMTQPASGPLASISTRYGLFCGLGAGIQPQSLHCKGMGIYAYDVNVFMQYCFYAVLADCDLSQFTTIGVEITTVQGNIVLDNTWIQAMPNSTAVVGVKINDLGSPVSQKVVINGCNLRGNGVAGSIGVYCGENEQAITISNSTIGVAGTAFDYGIAGIGTTPAGASANLVAKFNSIYSLTADISLNSAAVNADIGPNVNQNSGSTPFLCPVSPTGMRYTVNGMRGSATFAAGTTVAVTFAVPMPNATYTPIVTPSSQSQGVCSAGSLSATGFTVTSENSNSAPVYWQVNYG